MKILRSCLYLLLIAVTYCPAKTIEITGPLVASFIPGTICVHYHEHGQGKKKLCKKIQHGERYTFGIPDCIQTITIRRYYETGRRYSRGRFGVQEPYNIKLELEACGTNIHRVPMFVEYDDELPPLRTGIVYGWTWR